MFNFKKRTEDTSETGRKILELVNVSKPKGPLNKLTLIFKGTGEISGKTILRTFKGDSPAFISFYEEYCEENPIMYDHSKMLELRNSLFEVELTQSKTNDFINIVKFYKKIA